MSSVHIEVLPCCPEWFHSHVPDIASWIYRLHHRNISTCVYDEAPGFSFHDHLKKGIPCFIVPETLCLAPAFRESEGGKSSLLSSLLVVSRIRYFLPGHSSIRERVFITWGMRMPWTFAFAFHPAQVKISSFSFYSSRIFTGNVI